ncbi:MAG: anti-sigma factor antagonist [Bacteroidota bacterium]|jgi:anti-sigma B factor antagonist
MLEITTLRNDNILLIDICGDLDASSSIKLDKVLDEAKNNKEKSVLINCAKLNYISSAGLGVFMSYIEDYKQNGTYFCLYGLSEKVKNVFALLGLEKLIKIFNTEDDARNANNVN